MLLYKIINNMSAEQPERRRKVKPKIIRELKKLDKEYIRIILQREQQSKSSSRSFNK